MLAHIYPCSAQEFKDINQQKEYTLISTQLLQRIFTDGRINDHAIKCWQLLFNKARFSSNLEITISYNMLANELERSKRTIMRYIQMLSKNGYLEIISNSNQRQGFQPNTLLIRVPHFMIEKVKTTKNRMRKEVIAYPSSESAPKDSVELPMPSALKKDNLLKFKEKNHLPSSLISLKAETLQKMDETNLSPPPSDKRVILITNKKIKKNNNNSVVYSFNYLSKNFSKDKNEPLEQETKKAIQTLEEKIKYIEKLEQQEEKKLSHVQGNHSKIYQCLQHLGFIQSNLHHLNTSMEQLKKQAMHLKEKHEKKSLLTTSIDYFLKKPGGKILPVWTFKRLVNSLQSYGYVDQDLVCLINEIVFEVRFGSLSKINHHQGEMYVEHAINIALKLVRENRWLTPTAFQRDLYEEGASEQKTQFYR